MPKFSPEKELQNAIDKLRAERAQLLARVAQIDTSFGRLGIAVAVAAATVAAPAAAAPAAAPTGKKRGRPAKVAPVKAAPVAKAAKPGKVKIGRGKGGRGKFSISGEQSILDFVRGAGKPNVAEVNTHWTNEGRKATADTTVSKLVKKGLLKRVTVDGERGSRLEVV